jgi:hypothetical protein
MEERAAGKLSRSHVHVLARQRRPRRASLRLVGLFGFPALARHRRVRGVTLTRLPDSVRCYIRVAIQDWIAPAPRFGKRRRRVYTVSRLAQYWMDAAHARRNNCAMARYHHNVYAASKTPRYLVIFDLQWKMIDCERLEPATDLHSAMTTAIDRLTAEGWQPEGALDFGFVFINRGGSRRLLILTERDPLDTRSQTFSPFK